MHPADEMGKSLSQARGILSSLINCFDKTNANFVTGTVFVSEALTAIEEILSKAGDNLTELYNNYDLNTVIEDSSEHIEDESDDEVEVEVNADTEDTLPISAFGVFGHRKKAPNVSEKMDDNTVALPKTLRTEPLRPEMMADQPAQTYDELLEKLTAMADSAAFHAQKSDGEAENMVPVLEGLRADLIRMRSVA
jgi:hypothetical protein